MRYLPHTDFEIQKMLDVIGAPSIEALFDSVPAKYKLNRPLDLDAALDEASLMRHLQELSQKNEGARNLSFLGAGIYDHHIPPIVDQLLLRSEFYTAYTPYQAEVSQGTLQATFEFQTMVCQIFNMEVANASMYDGASATAEAVLMARRINKRKKVLVSNAVHPEYVETIRAYVSGFGNDIELTLLDFDESGRTSPQELEKQLSDQVSAVVVGYPNFLGCVEDLKSLRELTSKTGALLITATQEPYALSLLKAPGDFDVDIAVGEGQALSTAPQLGGPGLGLFSCKKSFLRQIPGRLVGQTLDEKGEPGFVLTLSTREQHIRRSRATSNICTNHGLIALAFAIRVALLGKAGFTEIGKQCLSKAEYLKAKIGSLKGFEIPFSSKTFNEFVVRSKGPPSKIILQKLNEQQIAGGVQLSKFYDGHDQDFLVSVTEKHGKSDLDCLVEQLAAI